MSWALLCWADPAQPLRILSTHSFLESYLWLPTKLPPASLERAEKAPAGRLLSSLGGMVWPFPDPFPGSAPRAHQEIPVPAPCPGSNEPSLLPKHLLTHRGWDFCAKSRDGLGEGGEEPPPLAGGSADLTGDPRAPKPNDLMDQKISRLERTHRDHPGQVLALHRTPPQPQPRLRAFSQPSLNSVKSGVEGLSSHPFPRPCCSLRVDVCRVRRRSEHLG